MNTWTLEHYGKEKVHFEASQVEANHGFSFIKCKDTTVVIEGKVKTVMLENCQGVKLVVNNVVSGVEVINCKKV